MCERVKSNSSICSPHGDFFLDTKNLSLLYGREITTIHAWQNTLQEWSRKRFSLPPSNNLMPPSNNLMTNDSNNHMSKDPNNYTSKDYSVKSLDWEAFGCGRPVLDPLPFAATFYCISDTYFASSSCNQNAKRPLVCPSVCRKAIKMTRLTFRKYCSNKNLDESQKRLQRQFLKHLSLFCATGDAASTTGCLDSVKVDKISCGYGGNITAGLEYCSLHSDPCCDLLAETIEEFGVEPASSLDSLDQDESSSLLEHIPQYQSFVLPQNTMIRGDAPYTSYTLIMIIISVLAFIALVIIGITMAVRSRRRQKGKEASLSRIRRYQKLDQQEFSERKRYVVVLLIFGAINLRIDRCMIMYLICLMRLV